MSLRTTYIVTDENGTEVFRGYVEDLRDKFGLGKKTTITYYLKQGRKLNRQYTVRALDNRPPENPSVYKELLAKQVQLLKVYDSVCGYSRDIEKNIADLAELGIEVVKREYVWQGAKRRKRKDYVLERVI